MQSSALDQWSVFLDEAARWEDISPLPLRSLPALEPVRGWRSLRKGSDIQVPATTVDIAPGYHGVSWWSTEVEASGDAGKLIRFGGVRLLAEVFWDRKRVAVDLEGMTPFEVRIPRKLASRGTHRIDVRVTNPGGSDSWDDIRTVDWGGWQFPASHDFGGPWQPVTVEELEGARISDIWVRPNRELSAALIDLEIESKKPLPIRIEISELSGPLVAVKTVRAGPGHKRLKVDVKSPKLYGPGTPCRYECKAILDGGRHTVSRTFGFRLLDVRDGALSFNRREFRMTGAISWGHYRRGPVPSAGDVEREAESVEAFGLNTFVAHRHPSTPELQDALEERGLLLYQEPGALGGPRFVPERADQRANILHFALLRIRRLAKRDRSRACLAWWNLANEWTSVDMQAWPQYVGATLRALRETDNSRITTFTSGWGETPMVRPYLAKSEKAWDFHRVYTWPNAWHPGAQSLLDSAPPPRDMLTISGEATCFTSLGLLDEIADSFPKQPEAPGTVAFEDSGAARWNRWRNLIEEGLSVADPKGKLGGIPGFCRGTSDGQYYSFARMIEAHRRHSEIDAVSINGWHQHHRLGTSGVVTPDRRPVNDPEVLRRANAPLMIAFKDLPAVVEAGEEQHCEVELFGLGGAVGTVDATVNTRDLASGKKSRGATRSFKPNGAGLIEVTARFQDLTVTNRVLVVRKQKPPRSPIAVVDSQGELSVWLDSNGVEWRPMQQKESLPVLATTSQALGSLDLAGGKPPRVAVLDRRVAFGYMPTDIGLVVAGGTPPPDEMRVHAGWIGGWAFSISEELPNLGSPGVLGPERYSLIPARAKPSPRGRWVAGVCSFPDAGIFDTGDPGFGATVWIDRQSNGTEVMTSYLPIMERKDEPLGGAVLMDVINWLAGD